MRQQRDSTEQEDGERHRADERDRRRLVVRVEGDAGHDGADPHTVVDDGERVQADLLLHTHRALRPVRHGRGESSERRCDAWGLERALAVEHPDGAPDLHAFVGCLRRHEVPADDPESRRLCSRLSSRQRDLAVGQPLVEQQVERRDADQECERDGTDDREQQACTDADAEPAAPHRNE